MTIMKQYANGYFVEMSQVLFFESALFGGVFIALSLAFNPRLFFPGVVASLIGYVYSKMYSTPRILKNCGLLAINGFFFGTAMANLFQPSFQMYACLLIGALAIPLVTKASFEVLQHWKLNPFVIPYILVVWVFSLSTHAIAFRAQAVNYFTFIPDYTHSSVMTQLIASTFTSMGRLFFFPNAFYGFAVFALVTAFNRRYGLYFMFGTAVATVASYFLSADGSSHGQYGLMTYSAGLVALGLASFPEQFRARTIIPFCVLSLFLTMAMSQFLHGLGLPVLTLPYVLTFWFAHLSRVPRLNVSWEPVKAAS